MMKHLYKTLLIAFISGSLLSFQMTAMAQTQQGTNTTDNKGVVTNTKTHDFDKVTDIDMLASLGMLAGGFITGRMLATYTPITNDVMIAGAGGVAFIAGEIMSNMKFKGTIDGMSIEVSKRTDGKVNEEQIQRLEDLKKSYEEAKKATKTKKTLQLASAAAFGIAAATSAYMAYTEFAAVKACTAAIVTAQTTALICKDVAASKAGTDLVPINAACTACRVELKGLFASIETVNAARISPGPSLIENKKVTPLQTTAKAANLALCKTSVAAAPLTSAAVVAEVQALCTTALEITSLNQIFNYKPSNIVNNSKSFIHQTLFASHSPKFDYEMLQSREINSQFYIDKALDLFFPKAQAGSWLPLLGLGAATAASFFLITGTTAVSIDMWMFVPFNRFMVFTGLAGVAFLASQSSDRVIGKLDDNIKKIDVILTDLGRMQKGIKAQNLAEKGIKLQTITNQNNEIQYYSPDGKTRTPCMTGNSSANCPPLADKLKSMPGFANLPESLRNSASQAMKMGDGLSGTNGISGSTMGLAESLGSKQNAIARLVKNNEAKLTKLSGGKFDVAKEGEKFQKTLNARNQKELRRQGMTATGMMAAIGSTPISPSQVNKELNSSSVNSAPIAGGVVDTSAKGEKKMDDLDLDFKEEAPAADLVAAESGAAAPEYDITTNEINADNGPSLFELISGRYIKSGYPKLLEEEPAVKK